MRNEMFRHRLQEELVNRSKRNPSFSARSFAKQLGIESSSLSQILNGKRPLTDKMCKRLGKQLAMSPDEVFNLMGVRGEDRKQQSFSSYTYLSVDNFKVIADWYHYAILELTYLPHFQGDTLWISKALGVGIFEIRAAVERLQRLEFLQITENGKWIDKLGDANNLGNEFTAPAMRKLQEQTLRKALEALESVSYEKRVQTSLTLPVPEKKIKAAKRKILNFIEEMDAFLREGDEPDEIYNMSFSLYPISESKRSQS